MNDPLQNHSQRITLFQCSIKTYSSERWKICKSRPTKDKDEQSRGTSVREFIIIRSISYTLPSQQFLETGTEDNTHFSHTDAKGHLQKTS